MDRQIITLGRPGSIARIADIVRGARELAGWSQDRLATLARTSQPTISRLETGTARVVDLALLDRVLGALGLDASLAIEGRHLRDRERQRDALHAKVTGFVGRRLARWGWTVAGEVQIGDDRPRGWIDLLAFRTVDRALLVEETKTDIPDFGALQRTLAFYEREAAAVARVLGWWPASVSVLVVALDSRTIARRLEDNRDLVRLAFPAPVAAVSRWLEDPVEPRPTGWALATCDPASRRSAWLRPTTLGSRRTLPAYESYADAASRLLLPR